jgi:hypothetical protein
VILDFFIGLDPSGTINDATPMGHPVADRDLNSKKTLCPPCLGEALRRETFAYNTIYKVLE